jgi:hypothetical protein
MKKHMHQPTTTKTILEFPPSTQPTTPSAPNRFRLALGLGLGLELGLGGVGWCGTSSQSQQNGVSPHHPFPSNTMFTDNEGNFNANIVTKYSKENNIRQIFTLGHAHLQNEQSEQLRV